MRTITDDLVGQRRAPLEPLTGQPVVIRVSSLVVATLAREARARGLSVQALAQRLFEAALSARFGGTGDEVLEQHVAETLGPARQPASPPAPVVVAPPAPEPDDDDREPTDWERRTARGYAAAGLGPRGIAREMGVDVEVVRKALKR